MYYFNDLTGKTFGKLTVIRQVGRTKARKIIWLCQCECGNTSTVIGSDLVANKVKSCGCKKIEKLLDRVVTHGDSKTRLYRIWGAMKKRCLNPNVHEYQNYGGRGITVCKEWLEDFCSFREWALQNGYKDHLTIDRIDVNGNYEPSNCRWATRKEQNNNRTTNHYLTFDGKTMNIASWAKEIDIKESILRQRIRDGWTTARALTQPVKTPCYKKSC